MEKFNPCDVCLYSPTKDSKSAMCYRCDLYKLKRENEYLSEFEAKMQSYINDSKKEKIIHGLQKCSSGKTGIEECIDCPYEGEKEPRPCFDNLWVDAFNLVISQKAEIGRLQNDLNVWKDIAHRETSYVAIARAETIKEFAERLEPKLANNTDISAVGYQSIIAEIINLVKEMTEESMNEQ